MRNWEGVEDLESQEDTETLKTGFLLPLSIPTSATGCCLPHPWQHVHLYRQVYYKVKSEPMLASLSDTTFWKKEPSSRFLKPTKEGFLFLSSQEGIEKGDASTGDRDAFRSAGGLEQQIGLGVRIFMTAKSQASLACIAIVLMEEALECLQGLGKKDTNACTNVQSRASLCRPHSQ